MDFSAHYENSGRARGVPESKHPIAKHLSSINIASTAPPRILHLRSPLLLLPEAVLHALLGLVSDTDLL
jgi:hypothetical protein